MYACALCRMLIAGRWRAFILVDIFNANCTTLNIFFIFRSSFIGRRFRLSGRYTWKFRALQNMKEAQTLVQHKIGTVDFYKRVNTVFVIFFSKFVKNSNFLFSLLKIFRYFYKIDKNTIKFNVLKCLYAWRLHVLFVPMTLSIEATLTLILSFIRLLCVKLTGKLHFFFLA